MQTKQHKHLSCCQQMQVRVNVAYHSPASSHYCRAPSVSSPCVQQLVWVQACNWAACEVAHTVHATLVAAHVALNQTRDDVVCASTAQVAQVRRFAMCTTWVLTHAEGVVDSLAGSSREQQRWISKSVKVCIGQAYCQRTVTGGHGWHTAVLRNYIVLAHS